MKKKYVGVVALEGSAGCLVEIQPPHCSLNLKVALEMQCFFSESKVGKLAMHIELGDVVFSAIMCKVKAKKQTILVSSLRIFIKPSVPYRKC